MRSNFIDYRIDTVGGQVLTGLIASETTGTVPLRRGESVEDVVPRSNISELTSMGLSMMPEGLEEEIDPKEMVDPISFIQSHPRQ